MTFFSFAICSICLASMALLLSGCGKSGGEPPAKAAPGAPQKETSTPQPAPAPITATVIEVKPQRVPIMFDVVGQTEGAKQVEVRARVPGILEKRLYQEGDPVKAGAPLFQIDRAPYEVALAQAKAALAQQQAQLEKAKRDEARLKPLVASKAVSQRDYDDALSAMQLAQAAVQQAAAKVKEAELNLSYTLVNAPVSGITGRAEHSEGSLISTDAQGSLLTTINQINPIWVRFSLAESDLAKLPEGKLPQNKSVQVELYEADGTKYPRKGRLNFSATAIDTRLGTQQLRAEFPNPSQELLPGQFVRVRLTAGERDNVFLVPQAAVMQTEKGFFVFVLDADGKAAIKPIKTGEWVGDNWTVLSGLNAGDRIITDNLLKIRPGAPVTAAAPQPATAAADKGAPNENASGASSGNAPDASSANTTPSAAAPAEGKASNRTLPAKDAGNRATATGKAQ